jgi:abequosyltransferase
VCNCTAQLAAAVAIVAVLAELAPMELTLLINFNFSLLFGVRRMNNIKLSFCIATLNRAAFIGATIESIISQATDEVEIVILDGASTDNTEQIVRLYQQKFPRLHYLRQETNMGVDRDYSRTVELANGEYCWFMSDDDILKPNAIQTVLSQAEQGYGLMIVNAEARTFDLSKVLDKQRLFISANRVYKSVDNNHLFVDTAHYLSFIGCVVIKRSLWNERTKEPYFGSLFVHVGVIFQSPLIEDTLVIAEPLIAIRQGNASWSTKAFEIWMFKWPNLIWSFPHYSDSDKSKVIAREPWRNLKTLFVYKAKGLFSPDAYHRLIESLCVSNSYKLTAKMIANLPEGLMSLLGAIYLLFFYRKSRIALYELISNPSFQGRFRWFSPTVWNDPQ